MDMPASSIVLPHRSFEEESWASSSARQSPLCQSPLAWRLGTPDIVHKLVESGIEHEVVSVVTELEEDLKVARDEWVELKDENVKLRETIEEGEKERSAKTLECVQLQGGLLTAIQESSTLKNENAKLQTVLMTEVAQLEAERQAALEQYMELQGQHSSTVVELEKYQEDNFALTKQISGLHEKLIVTLEQSMENQKKLQSSVVTNSQLQAKVVKLKNKVTALKQEKSDLVEEINRMKLNSSAVDEEGEDVERLLREILARRAACNTSKIMSDMKSEISNIESALQGVRASNGG